MKLIIRIFLWLTIIYNGLLALLALLLFWGPLYLSITKGSQYDWIIIIAEFIINVIGLIVAIIIYKSITKHKKIINQKNVIALIILIIVYSGLSLTFEPVLRFINILLAIIQVIILVTYPKLIKKYF